jgi:hypothetical protein
VVCKIGTELLFRENAFIPLIEGKYFLTQASMTITPETPVNNAPRVSATEPLHKAGLFITNSKYKITDKLSVAKME